MTIALCEGNSTAVDAADTHHWTGGSSGLWSTGGNWLGSATPAAWDYVSFDANGTANLTTTCNLNNDGSGRCDIECIIVTNPTSNVTINGTTPFRLGGLSVDMSAALQDLTINSPVKVDWAQEFKVATGRTLTLGGSVGNINGSTQTMTKSLGGKLVLGSLDSNDNDVYLAVTGGTVELNKASSGASGAEVHATSAITGLATGATVKYTGTGDYQVWRGGGITLTGGTLDLNGKSQNTDYTGSGTAPGDLTISTGGSAIANTAGGTASAYNTRYVGIGADFTVNTVGDLNLLGQLDSGSTLRTLTKTGAGKLTLTSLWANNVNLNATQGTTELNHSSSGDGLQGITNIAAGATVKYTGTNTGDGRSQVWAGATAPITLGGGTLDFNGRSQTSTALTVNTAGSAITNSAGGTTSSYRPYSGALNANLIVNTVGDVDLLPSNPSGTSLSGTGGIIKTGSGTLTLGGMNYIGDVNVQAGTLKLAHGHALGDFTTVANGAVLDFNGQNCDGAGMNGVITVAGTGIGGSGVLTNSAEHAGGGAYSRGLHVVLDGDSSIGGNAGGIQIDGITGGHALTKIGTNSLMVTKGGDFNYTDLTVSQGIFRASTGSDHGRQSLGFGTTRVLDGATLDMNGALMDDTAKTVYITGQGVATSDPQYAGGYMGALAMDYNSPDPGFLGTVAGYHGSGRFNVVLEGDSTISARGGLGTDGKQVNWLLLNSVTGHHAITITGKGNVGLNGNTCDYTDITIKSGASLGFGANSHSEWGSGIITIEDGGTLDAMGTTMDGAKTMYIAGEGYMTPNSWGRAGALTNTGARYWDGVGPYHAGGTGLSLVMTGDTTIKTIQTSDTVCGAISEQGGSFTLTKGGSGMVQGIGDTSFPPAVPGALVITGASSYTGGTNIVEGLIRLEGGNNRLPTGTAVTLGNLKYTALDINGSQQTIGSLSGGGDKGGNVALGSGKLTVGNADSTSFAGVVSGTGQVVKQGAGTLTLTGRNTYTGKTTVTSGTVKMGADSALGAAPGSAVADQLILNGGTLDLSGGVSGVTAGSLGSGYTSVPTAIFTGGNGTGATVAVSASVANVAMYRQGGGYVTTPDVVFSVPDLPGGVRATGYAVMAGDKVDHVVLTNGGSGYTSNPTIYFNGGTAKGGNPGGTNLAGAEVTGVNILGLVQTSGGVDYGTAPTGIAIDNTGAGGAGLAGTVNGVQPTLLAANRGVKLDAGGGTIHVGDGFTPSIAGNITGVGALTKTGGGMLTLTGTNAYAGRTTMEDGTLELGLNAQSPVLAGGGADIQGGEMVFGYTTTGDDPAATIKSLLTTSYHGGLWDTGKFQDTTAAATGLTLGWADDTLLKQVTVMATYAGDFNLDGTVNLIDYSVWKSNLGSGATWLQGDANYDGVVNLSDYSMWKSHLGFTVGSMSLAAAGFSAVPEPGSFILLLPVAGLWLGCYVARRRFK